jgi:hypothetical protein
LYDAIDAAITRTPIREYSSCQTARSKTKREENKIKHSQFINLYQEENSEIQCYDEIQDTAKEVWDQRVALPLASQHKHYIYQNFKLVWEVILKG